MRRFRTIWKWLTPGWLQTGQGELVNYVQGLVHDAYAERCRQTAWLMLPSLAPSDALPRIGADRSVPRGLFEPESSYRNRLREWRYPRGHRVRGSALALLEQVAAALRGTEYVTIDQRGTKYTRGDALPAVREYAWDWDGEPLEPEWARYWIVVKSSGSPWPSFANGAWGPTVGGYGGTISLAGRDVHPGELEAVRRLTQVGRLSWTPAGRRPIYLVLWFEGDTFPAPDGTWDSWENRDTEYRYIPLHSSLT